MQPEQGIKSSHQGIEQPHQGIPLGLECHLRLGSWIEESPDNVTQDRFTYIISWRIGRSVDLGRAGDECTAGRRLPPRRSAASMMRTIVYPN
jgi:hypothetical protein